VWQEAMCLYVGSGGDFPSLALMILPLAFSASSWGIWMSCSPSSSTIWRLVSPLRRI